MKKQPYPFLRDVQIETLNDLGKVLLRSFQLTFWLGENQGFEETEQVSAWMECERKNINFESCTLWRRVQRLRPGHAEPETSEPVRLAEHSDRYKGSHLLREFLYLWTRDRAGNEQVQLQLQQNMSKLPKHEDWQHVRDAFASVSVIADEFEDDSVSSYHAGKASTRAALRQVVLELPTDCSSFDMHFLVGGRIIGNAEYRVEHKLDPVTGKRESIFSAEYGACKGLLAIFADLYVLADPTAEELLGE